MRKILFQPNRITDEINKQVNKNFHRDQWNNKREKTSAAQQKKQQDITTEYINRLNCLTEDFFKRLSASNELNQKNFELLNSAWKQMAYKINRRYKFMQLPADAFEKNIERNFHIKKICELEPKFKPDSLNLLDDHTLKELFESSEKRAAMVSEIEKQTPADESHLRVVK